VRVDLLVTNGENEYVLEVNTLPGMTEASLLPKIAAAAGYDFVSLCDAILDGARLHTPARRRGPAEVRASSPVYTAEALKLVKSAG
jgi:D-alanine-D-alanine ligase